MKTLRIIIAVVMPPLSVYRARGPGRIFWINVLLTLLAFVPGVVHALWINKRR